MVLGCVLTASFIEVPFKVSLEFLFLSLSITIGLIVVDRASYGALMGHAILTSVHPKTRAAIVRTADNM